MRTFTVLILLHAVAITCLAQPTDFERLTARAWVLHYVDQTGVPYLAVKGTAPTLRLLPTADSEVVDRLAGAGSSYCNRFELNWMFVETGRILISPGFITMLGCEREITLMERRYLFALAVAAHYQVTDTSLRLWNEDSTVVCQFGTAPWNDYGARIQIVNLVEGSGRFQFYVDPTNGVQLEADSFPSCSAPRWFAGGIDRLAISTTGAGYGDRFFDTAAAGIEPGSYLLVLYRDTAGSPICAMVPSLDRDPSNWLGRVAVSQLSEWLGTVALAVDDDAGNRLAEFRQLPYRGHTGQLTFRDLDSSIGFDREQLRLRIARIGDGTTSSFVLTNPLAYEATNLLITGTPEADGVIVWAVEAATARPPSPLQSAPTLIGARCINLLDRAVEVTTNARRGEVLRPRSTTRLDDDLHNGARITIDAGSGRLLEATLQSLPRGIAMNYALLVNRWDEVDLMSLGTTSLASSVDRDTALLRLAVPQQLSIVVYDASSTNGVRSGARLRPGLTRLLLARPSISGDTIFASIDVPLEGGHSNTLIFYETEGVLEVLLFVDTRRDAQAPLRSLQIVRCAPWVINVTNGAPRGRLTFVNASARGYAVSVVAKENRVPLLPGWCLRYDMAPGVFDGRLEVGWSVLASQFSVVADSTTTQIVIDSIPARPRRVIELRDAIRRDTTEDFPRLRVVNALDDIDALDVVVRTARPAVPEMRLRQDEWSTLFPAALGEVRVDFLNRTNEILFSAAGELPYVHRYTALVVGTRAKPQVYLVDSDTVCSASISTLTVTRPFVAGVEREDTEQEWAVDIGGTRVSFACEGADIDAVDLVDVLGRVVLSFPVRARADVLPIDGVPAGVYLAIARHSARVVASQRVIVP